MRYIGLLMLGIIVAFGLALSAPADDDENAKLKRDIMDELEKKLDEKLSDLKKDLLEAIKEAAKKPEPRIRRVEPRGGIIIEGKPEKEKGKRLEKRHKVEKRILKKGNTDIRKELEKIFKLPEITCPHCEKKFKPDIKRFMPDIEELEVILRRLTERIVEGDAERGIPPIWRGIDPRRWPWRRAPGGEDEGETRRWRWGEGTEEMEKEIEKYLDDLDKMIEELEKALEGDEEGSEKPSGERFRRFRLRGFPRIERLPRDFWDNYKRKLDEEGEADEEYEEEFDLPDGGKGKIRVKVKGLKSKDGSRQSEERSIEVEKKSEGEEETETPEDENEEIEKAKPERLKRQRFIMPERF
ncbi:MAG: hypothetical protein E3J72_08390 [Planctomycetota bacterium]|nr:MAG: hypothetical protein E3J72_08390 [Planctomycetota bacterium]